ncbi:MAG: ABC transporter substrate-binding protein [Pseudomonadota bacterium]
MKSTLALCATLALATPAIAQDIETIASAGGDITEILFEFGVGASVIAVDSTSIYPEEVSDLPSIGYVRELSAEGVLATGADLLIGADDMGPPAVMDNLEAAGMRVEYAPLGTGAERYADKVNFVAEVLDMPERGAELIAEYEAALEEVRARADALEYSPRVMLILSVRDDAPIVAGLGTSGHDIVEIAGGTNIADFEGWRPMNAEAIIVAAPDIIVLSTAHIDRLGGIDAVMGRADIGSTPAGQNQTYVSLNAQMMLQFGPRAPVAMNDLITAFEQISSS